MSLSGPINTLFAYLEAFNTTYLWGYGGLGVVLGAGLFLSMRAKWPQVRHLPAIARTFFTCCRELGTKAGAAGIDPIRAFFASIGGCIGIGNLVGVGIAVQLGGPGALVWVWMVALLGMLLKYAEVYLGVHFRVPEGKAGFAGGPMYFLQKAFPKLGWLPGVMAFLMCIYGVEIYLFSVMKDNLVENFALPPNWVVVGLLAAIFLGVSGGVSRIGRISGILIPVFILGYCAMTVWVLGQNAAALPDLLVDVFRSAFTGHSAVGGFAGSTFLMTVSRGLSSAAYSGDIGIGYASIIHSESNTTDPKVQARLAAFGVFLDTFVVCTCTILLILVTGAWKSGVESSLLVQTALSTAFPHMGIFMPVFIFILGYSTITAYMVAGAKCARYLSPRWGHWIFFLYAVVALTLFAFIRAQHAWTIMNIAGGLLMLINIAGILKLRRTVIFEH